MNKLFKRILIITGHYGCGKTSLAISLAQMRRQAGAEVTLIDLDIVNPYFRTADFRAPLEQAGIRVITPAYASSNLDIPALSAAVDAAITGSGEVILDVGGDDAGAVALGRYAAALTAQDADMWYLFNSCRYLTATPEDCAVLLEEIQRVSRLSVTGLVNTTNLGPETTPALIRHSLDFARQTAAITGKPLVATAADARLTDSLHDLPDLLPVKTLVALPWQ